MFFFPQADESTTIGKASSNVYEVKRKLLIRKKSHLYFLYNNQNTYKYNNHDIIKYGKKIQYVQKK